MTPFIVLGSPRSRTAWLSTWLSDNYRTCHHDLLARVDDPQTLKAILDINHGTVETAACRYFRTLYTIAPAAKFAIVRRKEIEIAQSLLRHGMNPGAARAALLGLMEAETWLKKRTNLLCVDFADLCDERTLAVLWKHLRGDGHDIVRTRRLAALRIEKITPFWSEVAPAVDAHEASLR